MDFKNEFQEQKQLFLHTTARFNLRKPNSSTPTTIYLIINIGGKQYKISTNCKVYPNHWNKKEYRAIVNASLGRLIINNNQYVNNKIIEYSLGYTKLLDYLCNHIEEIENPQNAINSTFGIVKKEKKQEKISAILGTALRNKKMSDGAFNIFLKVVKLFSEWCDINNVMSIDEVNLNVIRKFHNFLLATKVKHKVTGEYVYTLNSTANCDCKNLVTVFGYLDKEGTFDIDKSKIRKITSEFKQSKNEENQVVIDANEFNKLLSLTLKGEEEIIRDLFCFQMCVAQRYSDIYETFCGVDLSKLIVDNKLSLIQKKTKNKVVVPIDDTAKAILEKYGYVLPAVDINKVDKAIKGICKKAEINTLVDCKELRNSEYYIYKVEKYKLVGTHTARRSFITNSVLGGVNQQIIKQISGHTTTASFERYVRLNGEQAVDAYFASKTSGNTPTIVPTDNGGQSSRDSIETVRKVLFFLGCDAPTVYEDDDLDRLERLVFAYENKIQEKSGKNWKELKKIFNDDSISFGDKVQIIFEAIK